MMEDEWLIPAGAPRALSPEEIREAIEDDPEVTLISDYLAKELTPDQAREVEQRLQDDEGFRDRVAPIIEAWRARPTLRDIEISEEEMGARWQRFLAKAAWRSYEGGDGGGRREASGAEQRRLERRVRQWQLAAALLLLVGWPLVGAGAAYLASRASASRLHVAEASGREWSAVNVGGDSWVTLSPGSRLTWPETTDGNGARELHLDGSARFRLAPLAAGRYVVVTPSAHVLVTGTTFEVAVDAPSATRVRVDLGRVVLQSRGGRGDEELELRVGETGEAHWGEPPRRVR